MKRSILSTLSGVACAAALLTALPARADVFSTQGFDGDTTTMDSLPGVNLNAMPGSGVAGSNCVERPSSDYSRDMRGTGGAVTECNFGSFSFSTQGGSGSTGGYDTTYGGNPPPWRQGWRP